MKIKKIVLENIRSYEHQEIDFVDGSTLLSGDIGSGKTSVLLAIEFALFGLQPGQRGSALLRNGASTGAVKLFFEIDGKEIFVERTLKKGKTISQDYCSILIDGDKRELSVTELKSKILELLNYPTEFAKKQNILYKFTVYTPQEEMKQIILEDSDTRINTLRHVFGIDKYKTILENVTLLTTKLREEKRMKEGMISNLEQNKSLLISKEQELEEKKKILPSLETELFTRKEIRKKIQSEKEEISKKIEEKNKLQSEVEKTKIMIANKEDTIFSNKKTITQLNLQVVELQNLAFDESEFQILEKRISENKIKKEKLNNSYLEINSKINSVLLRIEEDKKLENTISNLEICPTCLQNVDAVYRANVLNKIHNNESEFKNKINFFEEEKNSLSQEIKQTELAIYSDEKRFTDLRILKIKLQGIEEKSIQINTIEKSNSLLEKDIELLKQHLDLLSSSVVDLSKFSNLAEEKQKEFEEILRQERISEIKLAESKKEIEFSSSQIAQLKSEIEKVELIKSKLVYISELENWLSKQFTTLISFIEKNVMLKLKTEFSKLFAEWFYTLVSDTFSVRLSDDFTPIVEQQDYEIDYAYLSGGERTAIALAYRLALNQVINQLMSKIKTRDLIILDEPTDGFSEQQIDKMRDIFQQLNVGQLLVVSHEQKIDGFVDNVIKFKKENGMTKVN